MSSSNGTPPPTAPSASQQLREARAELRLARTRHELAHLQRRTKRLEESNILWDYGSAYSDLLDRLRTDDGKLLLSPSTVDWRRYGANWPHWRTWQEHALLRAQSRLLCDMSDIASGALSGLASYVIGEGHIARAAPRKGREKECPPALVDAVQAECDLHDELNDDFSMQLEQFKRTRRDGEAFLRDFVQDDGTTLNEIVEPEQIIDPPTGDYSLEEGSFGVITRPGHVARPIAYWVCYDGQPADGEEVPAEEMTALKVNVDRTVKRGMPDFVYDLHAGIKSAGRTLYNMTESAGVQASVAEIRQHEAATSSQAQTFADAESDFETPHPFTGAMVNNRRSMPGEVRDIPKNMTYVKPPFSDGGPVWIQITQAQLRKCGVKWNAPEWLISGDASNNSYSNSIAAAAPFGRRCQRWQKFYRLAFRRTKLRALQHAAEAGRIRANGRTWTWDEVQRLVDVQVEAPSLEVRDKLQEAQTNQVQMAAGVLSPQMWCQMEGRDYEQVTADIEAHAERTGQGQQQGLPMPDEEGNLPGGQGLGESMLEGGYTGRKKDKAGRTRCYSDGRQTACHTANASPAQGDRAARSAHEHVRRLLSAPAAASPRQVAQAAHAIRRLTKEEAKGLAKEFGLKGTGKGDQAERIATDAARVATQREQWARKARQAGVQPQALYETAKMMRGVALEYTTGVRRMLSDARASYRAATGKNLTRNHRAFRGGDPAGLPELETIARSMAGRYPELLGAHGYGESGDSTEAARRLYDFLSAGTPPLPTRQEMYGQVLDHLQESGHPPARRTRRQQPEEVPF